MDELARTRTDLERLEKKERDLEQQLSSIRMEIEVHKSRIESLVRTKPAPINSLPPEILSYVVHLAVPDCYPSRLSKLEMVSRPWRDAIIGCPTLWNNVSITRWVRESLVKTQVERSAQGPLDITINYWEPSPYFTSILDIVVPHVHRWRALRICASNLNGLEPLLDKFNSLKFPSLIRTTISGGFIRYPNFLRPENSPSLQSLDCRLIPMDDFPLGQRFTDLVVEFPPVSPFIQQLLPRMLLSLLSSQNLTTLKLVCSSDPSLQPNSIYLSSLTSLTLEVEYPRELFLAIVAPRLSHLDFDGKDLDEPLSAVFWGFGSKFRRVHHVVLHVGSSQFTVGCAEVVSLAFPNVRHVKLDTMHMHFFFKTDLDGTCPADRWKSLKSLAFHNLKTCNKSCTKDLVRWLERRQLAGRPMLQVKFADCTF